MNKLYIIVFVSFLSFSNTAQTVVETVSSGTSGDATLIIEADTDNNNEEDNPKIMLKQDGSLIIGEIGLNGTVSQYTGAIANSMFLGSILNSDLQLITNDIARITIKNNGYLGIGTTTPDEKLHVNGTTTITADIGTVTSNHWQTGAHTIELQNSDAGDVVLSFHRAGHTSAAIKHSSLGGLIFSGSGAFDANHVFLKSNGYFGIGTTTPDEKLAVNGNIHTKEVRVDLIGWSDFVFKEDYNLPTLKEVEEHIKEKGHLKDIPSEVEVSEDGILLGEMNAKLLQKIEELTLYTIQQDKNLKKQDVTNQELKERLLKLEQLITTQQSTTKN